MHLEIGGGGLMMDVECMHISTLMFLREDFSIDVHKIVFKYAIFLLATFFFIVFFKKVML